MLEPGDVTAIRGHKAPTELFYGQRHEFLVKIAIVQLESLALRAVRLEAMRDKEQACLFVSKHNSKVDPFQVRQGFRVFDSCLEQRLTDPLATQLIWHVHTPDHTLVPFLGLF